MVVITIVVIAAAMGRRWEMFGSGSGFGPDPQWSDAQLSASDPQYMPTILAPIYSFIFGPNDTAATMFGQYNVGTELQSNAILTELRRIYMDKPIYVHPRIETWAVDHREYDPLKTETATILPQLPTQLRTWTAEFIASIQAKMDEWTDRRLVLEFGQLTYMPVKLVAEDHVYFLTIHRQKAYYMYTFRIGYDDSGLIRLIDVVGNTAISELQMVPAVPSTVTSSGRLVPMYLNKDYNSGLPNSNPKVLTSERIQKRGQEDVCFNREPIFSQGVPAITVLRDRQTKKDCERGTDFLGRPQFRGVMDKPCVTSWDCPFYRGNSNYGNERGQCLNGRCEMPKGVTPIGYRYYQKDTEQDPMCYNCNTTEWQPVTELGRCCQDQMDRQRYPGLKGPDYAYADDQEDRMNHFNQMKYRVDGYGNIVSR